MLIKMTKELRIYTLLFLFISVIGCKSEEKEDVFVPMPVADFISSKQVATIGEEITFDNRSTDAISFEWIFESGKSSRLKNPVHTFEKEGTYNVRLKAFNSLNQIDEKIFEIKVGKRVFKQLWFDYSKYNLPENMFFYFGEVDNLDNSYYVALPSGIERHHLPFGGNLDFGVDVFLNDTNWFWMLVDNQPPLESFGYEDQLVFSAVLNPTRAVESKKYYGAGEFTVKSTKNNAGDITGNYAFTVGFNILTK